ALRELSDLVHERSESGALVPHDLAEEEVHALDRGGAFVQRVDLRVTEVLLDGVVLQITGAAEDLQRLSEQLVGTLGPDALDDRQQQVVEAGSGLIFLS